MPNVIRHSSQVVVACAAVMLFVVRPLLAQTPLTLQQAIAMAQRDGHVAKEAEALRSATQYRDKTFNARLLPQVSLAGTLPSYRRSISPITQPDGSILYRAQNQTDATLSARLTQKLPFSGGDFYLQSSLGRLGLSGSQNREIWSSAPVTIGLSQSLFAPNNVAWDKREQAVALDLSEQRYLESKEDLAIQITSLFFDAYVTHLSHLNTLRTAAFNDTLFGRNVARYQAGKVGESDKVASEIQVLLSTSQVEQSRLDEERAAAALRLALGMPTGAPLQLEMPLSVPNVVVDTLRAVAEASRNGTTPLSMEQQRLSAERAVNAAKKGNGVTANLSASFGYNATGDQFSNAYQQPQRAEQLALSLSMPILQYGAKGNTIRAAEADQERIERSTAYSLAQAGQDAHFAALQLPLARNNLAIAAKADSAAARYFEMQYELYGNGKSTIDLLYSAQSQKQQSFSSYLNALRGYWVAYYRLRRITLYDFERGAAIRE